MRGDDRELVRDVKVVKDARSGEECGEVRVGAHDDAHDWVHAWVAAPWDLQGWGIRVDLCLCAGDWERGEERAEACAQVGIGVCDESNVPHFPARSTLGFTVQVDSATGDGERSGGKGLDGVHGGGAGDDVEHDGGGNFEGGASKGEPEDGAEVILVLGGVAGLDGVVPRVMRTRSDFVDVYCTWGGGEYVDAGEVNLDATDHLP